MALITNSISTPLTDDDPLWNSIYLEKNRIRYAAKFYAEMMWPVAQKFRCWFDVDEDHFELDRFLHDCALFGRSHSVLVGETLYQIENDFIFHRFLIETKQPHAYIGHPRFYNKNSPLCSGRLVTIDVYGNRI